MNSNGNSPLRTNIDDLETEMDQEAQLYYTDGQPYTGIVYEMLQDQLDVEYEVIDGMKNGREVEYYPSGKIRTVCTYKSNLLDGPLTHYFENGIVQEQALFEKGVCIESTSFNGSGNVVATEALKLGSPSYNWLQYLRTMTDK